MITLFVVVAVACAIASIWSLRTMHRALDHADEAIALLREVTKREQTRMNCTCCRGLGEGGPYR